LKLHPQLRKTLDSVRARADLRARRGNDPVDFVHQYEDRADQELVALLAANLAFGNVKAIRLKVAELLDRVGPSPAKAAENPKRLFAQLDGWKHRVFIGEDVARLMIGARKLQKEDGSLGAAFAKALRGADVTAPDDAHEALKEALSSFCDRIRVAGGLPLPGEKSVRRGPVNLLSNARAGGGAKRLHLFLRWMVRPADGIDLEAYHEFRRGLLRHIGMEEKILLPAAKRARGGEPLPAAALLRLDHGALVALLVPRPTRTILAAIRAILATHNRIEEGPGGVYETCARLAGAGLDELLAELRAAPEVPVSAPVDDERAVTAARRALTRAGYDTARIGI